MGQVVIYYAGFTEYQKELWKSDLCKEVQEAHSAIRKASYIVDIIIADNKAFRKRIAELEGVIKDDTVKHHNALVKIYELEAQLKQKDAELKTALRLCRDCEHDSNGECTLRDPCFGSSAWKLKKDVK